VLTAGLALLLALPLLGPGHAEQAGAATSPTTTAGLSPLSDRRVVTGWIPHWDFADGVAQVIDNADVVAEVSPFWYRATRGSQVRPQVNNTRPESTLISAVDRLQAAGVAVLPSVTDDGVDASEMAGLLSDANRRSALIDEIVAMVDRIGADGVDIDFEDMNFGTVGADRTTVKRLFPRFLAKLGARLHAMGGLLSVAVPPRRSAADPSWEVFNYDAIGQSVDRARIMTYDYSTRDTPPGPIGPLDWTRDVMRYAASEFRGVPLSIGVPQYGQNWYLKTLRGTCPRVVKKTVPPTAQQALTLIDKYDAKKQWSDSAGEYHFDYRRPYPEYGRCVALRRVWFGEGRSAETRLRLAGRLGLQGIAVWPFGDEDPTLWKRASAVAEDITPDPAKSTLAAPEKVGARQPFSLTGRFTVSGLPVIGAAVAVQKRVPGGAWKKVGTLVTNATGRARYDTTAVRTLEWRMRLAAEWDWSPSLTRIAKVRVTSTTAKVG
jgi:spore germination protein YaaH